nr:DUF6543 domain-containing protein [uncultured Pseudomonas sp.]
MTPSTPVLDFKAAVQRQFASRPTLRQVLSTQLLDTLLEALPWLAFTTPALTDADPLMLDSPVPGTTVYTTGPLLDVVLQAMLADEPLDLEPLQGRHYNLGLTAAYRFAGSSSEFDTRSLSGITESLKQVMTNIVEQFCQAQVTYWQAQGSAGKSRDQWLQLLLKMALLSNLPRQGLGAKAQACIHGLIKGGGEQPAVFVLQANLGRNGERQQAVQPGLLVMGEWDEETVVLWCRPSSQITAFASLDEFALALRDELALEYNFETLAWDRHTLEGDVFAQWVALLLAHMLERIDRARLRGLSVPQMEALFAELSDPSQWLLGGYFQDDDTCVPLPPGLVSATQHDSFAFEQALLGMALAQAQFEGTPEPEPIEDLHTYARQRLREQMLEDYPTEANYFSDDLLLSLAVAHGMPGGAGTGTGGGEPLTDAGEMTLTAFAIGNLSSLAGAAIKAVHHRDGQLIMPWLTADYLKGLVQRVDIGARYPNYVATALNDPATRSQRLQCFARQWRQSFLFSALRGKLDGKVSEVGLQCVVDFCSGQLDPAEPSRVLMPLAFKRRPASTVSDLVQGMYVLFCAEPSRVLLYRPLCTNDPVLEYTSLDAMMTAIRDSRSLQQSMLPWMAEAARPIYDHDGFSEPHIGSIGFDPYDLPERPAPAELAACPWAADVDEKLYAANCALLLSLAEARSTSTAQSRWNLLVQGGWLLFDVVSLALRGPVASVAWLLQTLGALQHDVQEVSQDEGFARDAATVDLIINAGMTLLHTRLPQASSTGDRPPAVRPASTGSLAQDGSYRALKIEPRPGQVVTAGPLVWPDTVGVGQARLDFSWRSNQGFNALAPEQRKVLMAMRSAVDLTGQQAQSSGLYRVADKDYVSMLGETFAVSATGEGVRVLDPAGGQGPLLVREGEAWRIDTRLRLLGGMPRPKLEFQFKKAQSAYETLGSAYNSHSNEIKPLLDEAMALQTKRDKLASLVTQQQAQRAAAEASGDTGFDQSASDHLMERYQARSTELDASIKANRLALVATLEKLVDVERKQIEQINTLLEPKYGRQRTPGSVEIYTRQLKSLKESVIGHAEFALGELYLLADYGHISQMRDTFQGVYLFEVADRYRQFRSELIESCNVTERILALYGELDVLLLDALETLNADDADASRTVAQVIEKRLFTTVDLRFQHVLNLAEAALRLESNVMPRRLMRFKHGLVNPALSRASSAHGDSLKANLSAADRISILQEAWDAYTAAIVHSLHIEPQGGVLLDPVLLQRYREHMLLLKEDAGRRLVDAIAEQDGAQAARVPYQVTQEPQRVIRNNDGQLVIATEVKRDGELILEVREPITDRVLQVFERRADAWVERTEPAPPPQPVSPAAGDVEVQVQALLADHEHLLASVRAYVQEDVNGAHIERMLDGQAVVLQQASVSFAEQGASPQAIAALDAALAGLKQYRIEQLTALYSKTSYPTASALRFLHDQQLLKVEYVRREASANTSPFDEFKVIRLSAPGAAKGRALWAAHFHLPSQAAHLSDFVHAHLKLWSQRLLGRQYEAASGQRVHRGRLEKSDVEGIIDLS